MAQKSLPHSPFLKSGLRLYLLSFVSLFLELMLIRWVPSVYRLVAYYANLLLISSFLGLGMGLLLNRSGRRYDRLFPPALIIFLLVLFFVRHMSLPSNPGEYRFYSQFGQWGGYVALMAIFSANVAVFLTLGVAIGRQFSLVSPLRAYSFDLLGSLTGSCCFGLFSYFYFSPLVGFILISIMFIALSDRRDRVWSGIILLGILVMISTQISRKAIWSPYYYVTVTDALKPQGGLLDIPMQAVPKGIDPPLYSVHVNQDFYQLHGSLNLALYRPPLKQALHYFNEQYTLPFRVRGAAKKVLVVGAGGGLDVEAALMMGAESVDAVEIDPVLVELARRLNPYCAYNDPRVHLHIEDARTFFERTAERYDVIVFGTLDSQALFSAMSNVRLDGFVYTVESFRAAYERLNERGLLAVSFLINYRRWLASKLAYMLNQATGRCPEVLMHETTLIYLSPRNDLVIPDDFGSFHKLASDSQPPAPATDDWPYLYLSRPGIPRDYLVVMGFLLTGSLLLLSGLGRTRLTSANVHFAALGFAFMLLETKSVIDCSLFLGATWLVTTAVVVGVLLMILLANLWAAMYHYRPERCYIPLFLALAVILLVPHRWILGLPWSGRLAWAVIAVPLPIFFAGLVFSSNFRQTKLPTEAFGANLIGATLGGFAEYLGMKIGYHGLGFLVVGGYLVSLYYHPTFSENLSAK